MTQMNMIQTVLKDSNYNLALFSEGEMESLCIKVFLKTIRSKETPRVK